MANLLLDLAAGIQGMQAYDKLKLQQELLKNEVEKDKLRVESLKEAAAEAKKAKARLPKEAELTLGFLGGGRGPMGIAPPPGVMPPPEPPPVQAPMPGTQSQPMASPAELRRMIGPPEDGSLSAPPQAAPMPIGPQDDMGAVPQGPQMPPQGPNGIPPYQTVGGASSLPMGVPSGIPPPPVSGPRPNSMTMQDAVGFIQAQGINDPILGLNVLNNLTPFLNAEAKQQAKMLELEQEYKQKSQALEFKRETEERIAKDKTLDREERKRASMAADDTKRAIGQMNANLRAASQAIRVQGTKAKLAEGGQPSQEDIDLMASQALDGDKSVFVGLGRSPGILLAVRSSMTKQAKERGMNSKDIALATAGFEGLKAGERTLGNRTANIGMAVNEANLLSDLAVKASEEWQRAGIKSLNDLQKYAQGKTASPELRRFVAANTSFVNAYARAISPTGQPTVSDKEHAREMLDVAFSKGDYRATMDMLKQEMQAAQQSPAATKEELRGLFKGTPSHGTPASSAPTKAGGVTRISNAAEYNALPSGTVFIDPQGVTRRKP